MRSKNYRQNLNIYLVFIALFYALVVGGGLYGYGHDYYAAYYKSNLNWGVWYDRLGWRISTLTVYGVHLGVYVTSFILALCCGLLIDDHLRRKKMVSVPLFVFIFLIAIHTWPIIMSTSNAMRQGLGMSGLFVSLICFGHRKPGLMISILFLSSFLHKSILIFWPVIVFSYFAIRLNRNILVHLFFGLIGFFCALICIPELILIEGETRVIRGDFRLPFLLIALVFIIFCVFESRGLYRGYNIVVFYFSWIFPVFYILGLNWEFERIGMVMLLPYIFSFGSFLSKKSCQLYLGCVFASLLSLTFSTGMYASLE